MDKKSKMHSCSRDTEYYKEMENRVNVMKHELLDMADLFCREEVDNTIVFFGSSAIQPEDVAKEDLRLARVELERNVRPSAEVEKLIKSAEARVYMSQFYSQAEELAYKFGIWNKKFKNPMNEFVICSGGGPGIMEASNKGATRANFRSIGLNIEIPTEQKPNPYISPELNVNFQYFFLRKFWFFYFVKALIVFPGGVGTLDEIFEVLTLIKTGKMGKYVPIVLFGSEYWKSVINFSPMSEYQMVKEADYAFLKYSDDIEETFQYITSELEAHYPPQYME